MKRVSGGLFKNRGRKPRGAKAETQQDAAESLDPTASEDFSMGSPVPENNAKVMALHQDQARWSVAPDKNGEDDGDEDDDIYMSDQEDATTAKTLQTDTSPSISPTTPGKKKRAKSPKRKKGKQVEVSADGSTIGSMPLEASPGKLKKKKPTKKKSGSSMASTKSNKKKVKAGKAKKNKDTASDDEVDKSPKVKSPKKKTKKSVTIEQQASPAATTNEPKEGGNRVSLRSRLFGDKLFKSIRFSGARFSTARFSTIQAPPASPTDSKQSSTAPSPSNKEVDGKKLKADAVSKIRAFAVFRDRIQEQKQFLTVFNEEGETKETSTNQHKQDDFDKLVNELHNLETTLEKERAEMANVKANLQLQQESVEQLLQEETEKNREFEMLVQELQTELDTVGEAAQLDELKEKNRMLETQNELLQQKIDRQQETISSMMVEEKKDMQRQLSTGTLSNRTKPSLDSYLVSPSANRRKFRPPRESINEEGSMELRMEDDHNSPDWDEQSGFMSISSLPGKAQGELLQLRSALKTKNTALEDRTRELANVKQELETLKEDQGVKDLHRHVENLENEKKFFVSEIDKLKKELEESRKREQQATSAPSTPPQAEKETVGWFGFGGPRTPSKMQTRDRTQDIVNDLNGTIVVEDEPTSEPEVPAERTLQRDLSAMLDF